MKKMMSFFQLGQIHSAGFALLVFMVFAMKRIGFNLCYGKQSEYLPNY